MPRRQRYLGSPCGRSARRSSIASATVMSPRAFNACAAPITSRVLVLAELELADEAGDCDLDTHDGRKQLRSVMVVVAPTRLGLSCI